MRPANLCAEADIVVMNSKIKADAALLAVAKHLKMVCRAGVGMDHFDLPLLEARGILAVNTPGANAVPVGEQAVGMLLCMMHNIARADRQVRQFVWQREENRGVELLGKTVGIIGFGHTGSACARNLSGFGCRILAYDKYKSGYAPGYVEEASLAQIQSEADILTFHVPLTAETEGWGSRAFFASFAKPIYLLNLSRGPVVPLAGLLAGLEDGHVVAAGIDVLENEHLATLSTVQRTQMEALIASERVLFTPHIGGWSRESLTRINSRIVEQIADFLAKSGE
jgi:D-3-phosphoglycerate dehydrogenase